LFLWVAQTMDRPTTQASNPGDLAAIDLAEVEAEGPLPLIAYHQSPAKPDMPIVPGSRVRSWIEEDARHGRHCLPLMMANQCGWFLLNNHAFTARWHGEPSPDSLEVVYDDTAPRFRAHSAFGHGILSFMVPYLFRTPPGINLLVRGPSNGVRDGIAPLEGLVETDWAVATFTMNWRFTRPGVDVRFERDDPVCMLVPQQRGFLESFEPQLRDIDTNPDLRAANAAFNQRRHDSLVRGFAAEHVADAQRPGFEKDYMRGSSPMGDRAPEHQRKMDLASFVDPDEAAS
jgi:Family of unknown function (DUF6065)